MPPGVKALPGARAVTAHGRKASVAATLCNGTERGAVRLVLPPPLLANITHRDIERHAQLRTDYSPGSSDSVKVREVGDQYIVLSVCLAFTQPSLLLGVAW